MYNYQHIIYLILFYFILCVFLDEVLMSVQVASQRHSRWSRFSQTITVLQRGIWIQRAKQTESKGRSRGAEPESASVFAFILSAFQTGIISARLCSGSVKEEAVPRVKRYVTESVCGDGGGCGGCGGSGGHCLLQWAMTDVRPGPDPRR